VLDQNDGTIRTAAFNALDRRLPGRGVLPWSDTFRCPEPVRFAGRASGIFKPKEMSGVLSIRTVMPRLVAEDGLCLRRRPAMCFRRRAAPSGGTAMTAISDIMKPASRWQARIVVLVRWLDDLIGSLMAAKLRRCAGGACGEKAETARRVG
jgi:hypothetical protein